MVFFLIGTTSALNYSTHENQTTENPTQQGAHVLPSTLVLSLLLIILVLLSIYCLRFKNHRKALVTSVDKKIPNGFLDEQGEQTVVLLPRSPSPSRRYFPIPLDSLEEEYRVRSADDGKLFREEFNSLPCYYHHGSFEEASREHNREKNRYPNILPYDHSRVILSHIDGHLPSDYINASYIDGFKEKNKFIAAQGPKFETVADFWRMVWEQKVSTIVMLTNLKERKEDKCYQYWPDQGCWMYGNIRVAMEDFTVLVDYTIRKFCVQFQAGEGTRAPRLVTQLHFTSWPDFGVPFSPIGMLKFLKKVKTVNPSYAGPVVVHCSAGVGRTGTFIVIDGMIDMMHGEQMVDVFGSVSRIREQRCQIFSVRFFIFSSVLVLLLTSPSSTLQMQYSFIYQALLEYYLYGDTELDVCSLEGHLHRLHNTRAPNDRLGLEEEFRKLTNVRIMKENMRTGNLPANMKKNRVLQIIPCTGLMFSYTELHTFIHNSLLVFPCRDVEEYTKRP
uniref:protein-tyrosine-phosphatase n=1 Tax=Gadus morhua TaxID=8049 RepID=A0A8C5A0X3_GADMO